MDKVDMGLCGPAWRIDNQSPALPMTKLVVVDVHLRRSLVRVSSTIEGWEGGDGATP